MISFDYSDLFPGKRWMIFWDWRAKQSKLAQHSFYPWNTRWFRGYWDGQVHGRDLQLPCGKCSLRLRPRRALHCFCPPILIKENRNFRIPWHSLLSLGFATPLLNKKATRWGIRDDCAECEGSVFGMRSRSSSSKPNVRRTFQVQTIKKKLFRWKTRHKVLATETWKRIMTNLPWSCVITMDNHILR